MSELSRRNRWEHSAALKLIRMKTIFIYRKVKFDTNANSPAMCDRNTVCVPFEMRKNQYIFTFGASLNIQSEKLTSWHLAVMCSFHSLKLPSCFVPFQIFGQCSEAGTKTLFYLETGVFIMQPLVAEHISNSIIYKMLNWRTYLLTLLKETCLIKRIAAFRLAA